MPVGYLITLVLLSAATVVSLLPVRDPRPLARAVSVGATLVSELPGVAVLLLGASTALAVADDGLLRTAAGRVAVAAAALCAVGLLVLLAQGLRSAGVVDRALWKGLGVVPRPRRQLPALVRSVVAPYPCRPRGVERIADIPYGDDRRHRLDLYRPRRLAGPAPVLVYLHGGGYTGGGKHREARALVHRLAARGWVCVSANYRLRPAVGFPDHLVDVKRVITWVREEGRLFGADPRTVVVCGSSAGGHLSALAALTPNRPELQPGFEQVDTAVAAAVCLYGYYGRYYGWDALAEPPSSPLDLEAGAAPPFFVAHGDHDLTAPVQGARRLVAQLRRASNEPVVYAELPGAHHCFDLVASARFEAVVNGIEDFLHQVVVPARE